MQGAITQRDARCEGNTRLFASQHLYSLKASSRFFSRSGVSSSRLSMIHLQTFSRRLSERGAHAQRVLSNVCWPQCWLTCRKQHGATARLQRAVAPHNYTRLQLGPLMLSGKITAYMVFAASAHADKHTLL